MYDYKVYKGARQGGALGLMHVHISHVVPVYPA